MFHLQEKVLRCSNQAGMNVWDESYILDENSQKEGHYSVFPQSENLLEILLLKTNSDADSYESIICITFPC